jgi:hypothetical protein
MPRDEKFDETVLTLAREGDIVAMKAWCSMPLSMPEWNALVERAKQRISPENPNHA